LEGLEEEEYGNGNEHDVGCDGGTESDDDDVEEDAVGRKCHEGLDSKECIWSTLIHLLHHKVLEKKMLFRYNDYFHFCPPFDHEHLKLLQEDRAGNGRYL